MRCRLFQKVEATNTIPWSRKEVEGSPTCEAGADCRNESRGSWTMLRSKLSGTAVCVTPFGTAFSSCTVPRHMFINSSLPIITTMLFTHSATVHDGRRCERDGSHCARYPPTLAVGGLDFFLFGLRDSRHHPKKLDMSPVRPQNQDTQTRALSESFRRPRNRK